MLENNGNNFRFETTVENAQRNIVKKLVADFRDEKTDRSEILRKIKVEASKNSLKNPIKELMKSPGIEYSNVKMLGKVELVSNLMKKLKKSSVAPTQLELSESVTQLSNDLSPHLILPFILNQTNPRIHDLGSYVHEQLKNRARKPGLLANFRSENPDFTL